MGKKPVKHIFEPPNEELLRQSDEDRKRIENILRNLNCNRIKFLQKEIQKLKDKWKKDFLAKEEFYKIRDELVCLCQTPFSEREGQNMAINVLFELYDPLITRITKEFCEKRKLDLDTWKSNALMIFYKMVLGDIPRIIDFYKEKEKNSFDSTMDKWDKNTHKRWELAKDMATQKRKVIQESNLLQEEKKIAYTVINEELNNFPKWVNQPPLLFTDWIKSILFSQERIIRMATELTDNPIKKFIFLGTANYYKLLLYSSKEFDNFIKKNRKKLKAFYEEYQKNAYRDKSYNRFCDIDFTTYVTKWLWWELSNLYKRKEVLKTRIISIDKVVDEDTNFTLQNVLEKEGKLITPTIDLINQVENTFFLEQLKNLSPRRRQISELIMASYNQTEIASILGTTKAYINKELKKIGKLFKEQGLV